MVKNSLPGQKPPSITRRETKIDPFDDAVEDDVDDPKMKMMVKLRGEVVGEA
jgi:hypothetical protein